MLSCVVLTLIPPCYLFLTLEVLLLFADQARGKIGDFIKGVFAVFQGTTDLGNVHLPDVVN